MKLKRSDFLPEPLMIVLFKRIAIVYVFYSLARLLFYVFNKEFFHEIGLWHLINLCIGGIKFDTAAILYTNSIFIIMHIIPFRFRYRKGYQTTLFVLFVVFNTIGLLANFIDIGYYPFTLKRTTFSVFSEFMNEENGFRLAGRFLIDYWYISILFFLIIFVMIFTYKKITTLKYRPQHPLIYYTYGVIFCAVCLELFVGGVRGGFKHSTRPITLSNAGDFVNNTNEMHIVLNTPFSILKTIQIEPLQRKSHFPENELESIYNPVKHVAPTSTFNKKNVIIIILESFGSENIGFYNQNIENGTYKGYAPFLDSLCQHSMVFLNSFANGKKSIDALPSVISSIPAILKPFVLTQYYDNHLESLPNLLKKEGYRTSFFHGAPNGSMGFSAFLKVAGVDEYYGKDEYNNNSDYDGIRGIWDEPFLQFMSAKISTYEEPFFASVFTVTSHHPYELPPKYSGVFPEGTQPLHRTLGYTDNALRNFFNTAAKEKWFNNTIFVITADHVNSHPERPYYLTSMGLFRVPVIIYQPGIQGVVIKDKLIQQIDIMPTVLGLLHYPHNYFSFGFDVLHENNCFVANYLNNQLQIFRDGYMLQFKNDQPVCLYNFLSDSLLKNNLLMHNPEIVDELVRVAKAFDQQYCNRMIEDKIAVH